jgi:hypothetical protein
MRIYVSYVDLEYWLHLGKVQDFLLLVMFTDDKYHSKQFCTAVCFSYTLHQC